MENPLFGCWSCSLPPRPLPVFDPSWVPPGDLRDLEFFCTRKGLNIFTYITGKHFNKCFKKAVFMTNAIYVKYELEGEGVNLFMHVKGGYNLFFELPTKFP